MIHLINRTPYFISITSLHQELLSIIEYLEKRYQKKTGEVSYCFLSEIEIKSLNKNFLGKNTSTDVLSFPDYDKLSITVSGDIGVCLDVVKRDAKKDNKKFSKYLAEVLLHGSLHLFGLEHNYTPPSLKRVHKLHREILNELKLNWRAFNIEKHIEENNEQQAN